MSYIPGLKVLNVGCGNSVLPEEMYDTDGYREIYSMDISQFCIDQMKQRNQETRPELVWQVMNCTSLEYEDEFFDLIIDKSTIDCLVCGSQAYKKVALMTKECQRVLKTGGFFVSISFGQPLSRELHYRRPHLKLDLKSVPIRNPGNKTPVVSHRLLVAQNPLF